MARPLKKDLFTAFLYNQPRDLLLDGLCVGLPEQVEEETGEVVGVRVGVPEHHKPSTL